MLKKRLYFMIILWFMTSAFSAQAQGPNIAQCDFPHPAPNEDSITWGPLTADCLLRSRDNTFQLLKDKSYTLNGNGHTVYHGALRNQREMFRIINATTFTINNTVIDAKHPNVDTKAQDIIRMLGGDLTLNNTTLKGYSFSGINFTQHRDKSWSSDIIIDESTIGPSESAAPNMVNRTAPAGLRLLSHLNDSLSVSISDSRIIDNSGRPAIEFIALEGSSTTHTLTLNDVLIRANGSNNRMHEILQGRDSPIPYAAIRLQSKIQLDATDITFQANLGGALFLQEGESGNPIANLTNAKFDDNRTVTDDLSDNPLKYQKEDYGSAITNWGGTVNIRGSLTMIRNQGGAGTVEVSGAAGSIDLSGMTQYSYCNNKPNGFALHDHHDDDTGRIYNPAAAANIAAVNKAIAPYTDCPPPPSNNEDTPQDPGRVHNNPYFVIYRKGSGDQTALEIYEVNDQGQGTLVLTVKQTQFNARGGPGCVLASANRRIAVMRSAEANAIVMYGPDFEGKIHHVTLKGGLNGSVIGTKTTNSNSPPGASC